MSEQTKQCQNCKKEFIIDSQDFAFYKKIKVPSPTWCPDCRLQRRLVFRNEKTLYSRKCDLCKETMISIYHKDSKCVVYCQKCWWSDKWDPIDYGLEYDFNKPFFEQFNELKKKVPRVSLVNTKSVNSEYTNLAADNKNCYLLFESSNNERCDYSYWMQLSKDCVDCSFVNNSQLCYEVLVAWNCYQLFFSRECRDCVDSYFLKYCIDCSNCYACVNLRHKKYHIFNKPYSKEEYLTIIKRKQRELLKGNLSELKKEFEDFVLKYINKYSYIQKSVNSTGNYLLNTKNCKFCFHSYDAEDCKYGYHVWRNSKDNMDVCTVGREAELIYETINTGMNVNNIKFGILNWHNNHHVEYSDSCQSSSDLFGCLCLRSKQYCILNKQYTKQEYQELMPKIIEHMNQMPYIDGQKRIYKYGEFFPLDLTLFSYNETSAQDHFPFTKKQAIEQGYSWKDSDSRNIKPTVKSEDLPEHIKDIEDSIIKEIVECTHQGKCDENCTTAFRIIPQELDFYRKMNLPLPRLCPNCRHYQRIKQRNPLKLWKRRCMCNGKQSKFGDLVSESYINTIEHFHKDEPCSNEFETTYAPERPEIVYCEACYKQEVN